MNVNADLDDVKNISRCGFYLAQGSRCANKPEADGDYWVFIAFRSHSDTFFPILAIDVVSPICYCGVLDRAQSVISWTKISNS